MSPALEWELRGRRADGAELVVEVEWTLVSDGERTPVLHDQMRVALGASVEDVREAITARAIYVAARYLEAPADPPGDPLDALAGNPQRVDLAAIGGGP